MSRSDHPSARAKGPGDPSRGPLHPQAARKIWPGREGSDPTRGFTLVEILTAMALTAFGVLGLTSLLVVLGKMEEEVTWRTKALFCAEETMEGLRFGVVSGDGGEEIGEVIPSIGPYRGMLRAWTLRPLPDREGLFEIRVECSYPWEGSRKAVRLATLVGTEP